MHVRRAIALAAALATALATGRAHAWSEAHEVGDETRVVVDGAGVASEEHRLRWHVQRGPLASIDLPRLEPGAVVEHDVAVASDDGRGVVAHAAIRDDGTVRITVDDPRALMRGTFTFDVRWHVDLVAAGQVVRDGSTLRLVWSAPPAAVGLDDVRTTFDLPAAPEEPRPLVTTSGLVDESAVATLTRGAQRDVLELVRPHVPGGEPVMWTLRLDGHTLPLVTDPRVQPPQEGSAGPEPDRVAPLLVGVALAGLALGFGLLVWHKARGFAGACAARGTQSRGLLPLPDGPRAVLAGAALAAAVGLEVTGEVTAGAACVSVAVLAAAIRAPRAALPVRGPGRWQPLPPGQAFPGHARDVRVLDPAGPPLLDVDCARGRAAALVVAGLAGAIAVVIRRFDADAAWLAMLDAAVLAPLFATGRASQMPPHGVRSAASWLAGAFRRLRRVGGLQVTPWVRVAPDGFTADELRLIAMPRMPMPGLIGLEVGLAWSRTPVSWAAAPEVLARVIEGSPAAKTLARDLPRARAMLGRRPEERVVRLSPRAPTRESTAALVRALAEALSGPAVDSRPTIVGSGPGPIPDARRPRPPKASPRKGAWPAPARPG
jgi:hypothetical protein